MVDGKLKSTAATNLSIYKPALMILMYNANVGKFLLCPAGNLSDVL